MVTLSRKKPNMLHSKKEVFAIWYLSEVETGDHLTI